VRLQIDMFLAGDKPLWEFPRLFRVLLEYALIPAVERRIEAVHAHIHRIARACFGAGLAYICAFIRCEKHLDRLASESGFQDLATKDFRSRALADRVLHLRYPADELRHKTFQEKLLMIYQTGREQEFEDTAAARTANAEFKIATSDTRQNAAKPPDHKHQPLLYLKSLLENNCLFAAPIPLLDMATASPDEFQEPPPGFRALDTAIAAAVEPAPDIVFDDRASRLFQVVNNNPQSRVLVASHHIDQDRRAHVCVLISTVRDADPTRPNKVIVTFPSKVLTTLDLRAWVPHIGRVLTELSKWRLRRSATTPEYRPEGACPLPLPSVVRASVFPELATSSTDLVAASSSALMLVDRDEVQECFDAFVAKGAFAGSGVSIVGTDEVLDDVSELTIQTLVRRAVLKCSTTGAVSQFALNPSCVHWSLHHGLVHPVPLTRITTSLPLLKKTKMEIILALRCDGWQDAQGQVLAPCQPGGPRLFSQSWQKPLAYFACLHDLDRVANKGVLAVRHDGKNLYYRCLLLLEGAPMQEFLLALEDTPELLMRKMLRNAGDDDIEEVHPIEDLPEGFRNHGLGHPIALDFIPPPTMLSRCIVSATGFNDQKVYFDHLTSGGAKQKGYSVCSICGTTRWKVVDVAREQYLAIYLAWARGCMKSGGTRELHRPWVPPPADVQEALLSLHTTDF